MRCVFVLSVSLLVALLAACGKQPADNLTDALAVDPVRLKALRAQCAADGRATGEDASHGGLPSVAVKVHRLRRIRRTFAEEAPSHLAGTLRGRRLPRQL